MNDGTSARVDARKSRDALERTSTTHWTVSAIVSITACCICTSVDIVLCLQLLISIVNVSILHVSVSRSE